VTFHQLFENLTLAPGLAEYGMPLPLRSVQRQHQRPGCVGCSKLPQQHEVDPHPEGFPGLQPEMLNPACFQMVNTGSSSMLNSGCSQTINTGCYVDGQPWLFLDGQHWPFLDGEQSDFTSPGSWKVNMGAS
jgi:hypothetical protein